MSQHRRLRAARETVIDRAIIYCTVRDDVDATVNGDADETDDVLNLLSEEDIAETRFREAVQHLVALQAEAAPAPHSRPGTSERAARLADVGTWRGKVQRAVFDAGRARTRFTDSVVGGLTCFELERKIPGARERHSSISSAVNWAENAGWIRDSGHVRCTGSGAEAIVYEPTDKLVALAAAERRAG